MKGGGRLLGATPLAAGLLLALAMAAAPALASDVGLPAQGDGLALPGDGAAAAASVPGDGPVAAADVSAPDPAVQPQDPPRVETLPRDKGPGPFVLPGPSWAVLVVAAVVGVISTWAPGELRRMRIESAWRVSNGGRLALARGEFALALAAFDRAIDEAHAAYTRRVGPGQPVEWKLLPDPFYIGLWRGRAAALRGLGRVRAAEFTDAMAKELEATVASAL